MIYAQNNLRNFIGLYNKINDMEDPNLASTEKNRERSIASIPKEDRDLILKRADEGNATSSDIYILLKGQNLRNKNIGFNDVELIFRRLSINMTEHRFSEILCATKLMRAQKSIGFANLNFSSMDEDDFESIFLYLEECITDYTKESLAMSFRNLIKHSLASIIIFLFTILVTSYIKIYFYGGGLIGSILCALIPICTSLCYPRHDDDGRQVQELL